MRKIVCSIVVCGALGAALPVAAQTNLGDIVSGVAQSLLAQEMDKAAYAQAQNANTVAAYRGYLTRFPKGIYRVNAENALRRLGASVSPDPVAPAPVAPVPAPSGSAASVEAALGLTRADRVQLQRQLSAIGYETGVADGLWGANTRRAISRWQTANRLTATGYLTRAQVRLIAQQAGPAVAPQPPVASGPDEDLIEERLLALTVDERREIQRRLTLLGYSTGGADGVFGANTRRALAAWQRDEGLRASGYITADQLRELRRQTG